MQNRTIRALLCAALLCLLPAGCGKSADAALAPSMPPVSPEIVFAAGSVSPDAGEIKLALRAGETALLDSLPALSSADLSGSEDEREDARRHPRGRTCHGVGLVGTPARVDQQAVGVHPVRRTRH